MPLVLRVSSLMDKRAGKELPGSGWGGGRQATGYFSVQPKANGLGYFRKRPAASTRRSYLAPLSTAAAFSPTSTDRN